MTSNEILEFSKNLKHATTDFKIEWNSQRYFVCEKMFAMNGHNKESEEILSLKLLPEDCAYLRENNDGIVEGYYLNKVHWVSLILSKVEDDLVKELMERSYEYFITTLPKKKQMELSEK